MSRRRLAWLLVAAVSACTHGKAEPPPLAATRRFLQDATSARIDAAYARMSEAGRQLCDRACFGRAIASGRPDWVRALDDVQSGRAQVDQLAELALSDGTALRLALLPGPLVPDSAALPGGKTPTAGSAPGFLLTSSPLDFYPQSSPEQALRSFVRAARARRYEVLLRFVPQALREQVTAEQLRARFEGGTPGSGPGPGKALPDFAQQLRLAEQHLGEPFILEGSTARLPVGDGGEAKLVAEDGRWCVLQIH